MCHAVQPWGASLAAAHTGNYQSVIPCSSLLSGSPYGTRPSQSKARWSRKYGQSDGDLAAANRTRSLLMVGATDTRHS